MNKESRKIILEYKTQIIVLLFSILAIIVSIIVLKGLIKIEEGYIYVDKKRLSKQSEFSSLIFLFGTLYFTYTTYKNYMKNKSKDNFSYLIATLFALIAASIRYITLIKNNNNESSLDDIVI
jgi:sorbitol-specific phosphotransferase system component IIC